MCAVYPRVCGGTGTVHPGVVPESTRSIPACAGEPYRVSASEPRTVYPRVCGGTWLASRHTSTCIGLSPRVRGNHEAEEYLRSRHGSIPACAGEPPSGWGWALSATVYPRVCGGTTPGERITLERLRSIPACAGEPSLSEP